MSAESVNPIAAARPATLANRIAYEAFWWSVAPLLRVTFRMRIENPPRIDGPFVIAGNHASYLDPVLLGAASRRRITYLMTAVVYRSARAGWFYRFARAIPLEVGGGNRAALRAARETLRRGEVIGIFPEGGLSRDGRLVLGNPGAVSLVLGEQVPVVPVGILGAYESLPPHGSLRPRSVTIRFGDPIPHDRLVPDDVSKRERFQLATRRIMDEIATLTGQSSREEWLAGRGRVASDLALNA
jgi:1-acyl-sn-glycerol-3-phosphate acyltransferase